MKQKNQRTLAIFALALAIVAATIAYVALSTTLNTSGTVTEKGESTSNVLCKAVTTATTGNIPTGNYAYGDEYTCELGDNEEKTFFVLETNGDNVSLIMDRNIDSNGKGTTSGNTVAWSSDGRNHKDEDISAQAVTAKAYLKTSTASWTKLTSSQISLPTYDQIVAANGGDPYSLLAWLYGNLNSDSAPYGYWTSTPDASSSYYAWDVTCRGSLFFNYVVDYGISTGVRPVITISKSNIS